MTSESPLFGAIEGGGTKFVCAVANEPANILESKSIPTTEPEATLAACIRFFDDVGRRRGPIAALGFACFGPLALDPGDARFGHLRATPKAGWSGADLLSPLTRAFDMPMALDTDVAAAARAEWQLGAGRGAASLAYVTVGTGIGGAVAPLSAPAGAAHAEMGHLLVRRDPRDQAFAGTCPFHGDCLEGLASGPAIVARYGATIDSMPAGHVAHSVIGGYLGQLAASIALMHAVDRIAFGGGVMSSPWLLPEIRSAALGYLNGYVEPLNDVERAAEFIVAPSLGPAAGIVGAVLLAEQALADAGQGDVPRRPSRP